MALREFDRHDHPRANPFLPQVGCGICGHAVQPAGDQVAGVEHWDELEPAAQQAALEAMAAWSHEHAATHGQEDHQAHENQLRMASR